MSGSTPSVIERIQTRTARIGVIGLGYVGLPLVVEFARAGFRVTGAKDGLLAQLAGHDDVEGVWYWGTHDGVKAVELASASNMKRTWCHYGAMDWASAEGEGREFLRAATHVKNIWIPYGE